MSDKKPDDIKTKSQINFNFFHFGLYIFIGTFLRKKRFCEFFLAETQFLDLWKS